MLTVGATGSESGGSAGAPSTTESDRVFFAELRAREFARLDRLGQPYLDYTGSGLYAESQIVAHHALLLDSVLGNPHSDSAPSRASTEVIERARAQVLSFLDASPDEYTVVFTANTSAAIKLIGESFPFAPDTELLLSVDNHNSVNGLREFARRAGAGVRYLSLDEELRLANPIVEMDARPRAAAGARKLLAFPAQSNFSGVIHPLTLVREAQQRGYRVLLDAAAFAPTSELSLRQVPADFVELSFYKVFGFPSGVAALVAKRSALEELRRPWFAGGTVEYASVQNDVHRLRAAQDGFEDGTPAFLSIAGLAPGFAFLNDVGVARIGAHARTLTGMLLAGLQALRHDNGSSMVRVYGPTGMEGRGATVTFNVLNAAGRAVPFATVEAQAREAGVALRGGCFCNPGATEIALAFPAEAAAECFRGAADRAVSIAGFAECLGDGVAVDAVRASLGIASNAEDVQRAVDVVSATSARYHHATPSKKAPTAR